jgi:hypothetical protein
MAAEASPPAVAAAAPAAFAAAEEATAGPDYPGSGTLEKKLTYLGLFLVIL